MIDYEEHAILEQSCLVPKIFCWTRLGTEAGQSVEAIVWRKEMERLAGNGTFCWGIGNALGDSPAVARRALPGGNLEVLFSPMKSAPKSIDETPKSIVMWLNLMKPGGHLEPLPNHMLVTSRKASSSGSIKRHHYALICTSNKPISFDGDEVIDAAYARNFPSENPVGSSQVTAIVSYKAPPTTNKPENPYRIVFRAGLTEEGFVRLATPVELEGDLLNRYYRLCESRSAEEWYSCLITLKKAARQAALESSNQGPLFTVEG